MLCKGSRGRRQGWSDRAAARRGDTGGDKNAEGNGGRQDRSRKRVGKDAVSGRAKQAAGRGAWGEDAVRGPDARLMDLKGGGC